MLVQKAPFDRDSKNPGGQFDPLGNAASLSADLFASESILPMTASAPAPGRVVVGERVGDSISFSLDATNGTQLQIPKGAILQCSLRL